MPRVFSVVSYWIWWKRSQRGKVPFLRIVDADRGTIVERFQDAKHECCCCSLSWRGGLTAADYVFILDPWWNPAAEDRADRAHRIGQTNPVFVTRLAAKDYRGTRSNSPL